MSVRPSPPVVSPPILPVGSIKTTSSPIRFACTAAEIPAGVPPYTTRSNGFGPWAAGGADTANAADAAKIAHTTVNAL